MKKFFPCFLETKLVLRLIKNHQKNFLVSNFVYPWSDHGRQRRRFYKNLFNLCDWIEYGESKDLAFCLSCFLFKNVSKSGG